ncbi:hypothetical protein WJX74_002497 [Apatococcus lobatus]|uniref:HAUS augmin-like complex subunit 4 n=1 Tax=Apatococcus lobatus TaxID=904363 RepID=A0AAW1SBP7_9CHLO
MGAESILHRYLMQQALQSELGQLFQACNCCLESCGNDLLYDMALKRDGFTFSYDAAVTAQLQLSVQSLLHGPVQLTPALSKSVSKGSLRNSQAAQELHPDLDCQLSRRIKWLAEMLDFEGKEEELPAHIKEMTAKSRQDESQIRDLETKIEAAMKQLLDGLKDCTEVLIFLMLSFKLDQHTEHARIRATYLRSHCETLVAKVASFERRLLAETYTSSSVLQLDAIAQELASSIKLAEQDSCQAMASLEAYEQLGPEMLQLAKAHHDLDAELQHAEFTLQEFQRVTLEDD